MDFVTHPSGAIAGQEIFPHVVVSALVAKSVTMSLVPSNVPLGGTLTQTVVADKATFNDLKVGKAGVGYKLAATATFDDGTTAHVLSLPFNVTKAAG